MVAGNLGGNRTHDIRIRSTVTLPTELRGGGESRRRESKGTYECSAVWVRFPPRSKDFFFTSCGSLISFTRANAQWVIHGFN